MTKKIAKVLLVNQGSTDNVGDQLINEVLSKILRDNYEVYHVNLETNVVLSRIEEAVIYRKPLLKRIIEKASRLPRKIEKMQIGTYQSLYNETFRHIHKIDINSYDVIIVGGGELLKSNHLFLPTIDAWSKYVKENSNARLILFGISADQSFTDEEILAMSIFLKRFDFINVRDISSKETLKKIFELEVDCCPDCVFSYCIFDGNKYKKNQNVVVSIFDYDSWKFTDRWPTKEIYFDYWLELVRDAVKGDFSKVRFSYTTKEDAWCTRDFYEHFKNTVCFPPPKFEQYNAAEIIKDLAEADILLSGRMHAMIVAKQYQTKIVPFIFKNKIECFVNTYETSEFDSKKIILQIERSIQAAGFSINIKS